MLSCQAFVLRFLSYQSEEGTRLRLVSWKIGWGGADFSCSDVQLGPYDRVLGVRAFPMRSCRVEVGFFLRAIASATCRLFVPLNK